MAQKALEKMDFTKVTTKQVYRETSCTAVALAAFRDKGMPTERGLARATQVLFEHRDKSQDDSDNFKQGGLFGLKTPALNKVYGWFDLKRTKALIDGNRFPKTCILQLRGIENGNGHAVARIDGVLYDRFDCRESDYEIIAFWK